MKASQEVEIEQPGDSTKEIQHNRTHCILSLIVIIAALFGSLRTIWTDGSPDFKPSSVCATPMEKSCPIIF